MLSLHRLLPWTGLTLALFPYLLPVKAAERAEAIFAGGCFWTVESAFEKVPGVIDAISGFAGGTKANPTYNEVTAGGTGHYEAVKVIYDPAKLSYSQLTEVFFYSTDPTQTDGQVCDIGDSYRTAIFATPAQMADAKAAKATAAQLLSRPIATVVLPASPFYAAETAHQNYWKTNSAHYNAYRQGCGRDTRLAKLWGAKAWPGLGK